MMKHITKVVLFLFLGILNITAYSCSKSIYVHSDEHGSSSFTIYKRNYKYTEKTAYTDFETWGTHYISNDSTLTFVYKKPDQLPYTYLKNNIRKTAKTDTADFVTIKIIDQLTQEPIGFGTIGFYDKSGKVIDAIQTDIEGFGIVKTEEEFTLIEIIDYLGYTIELIRGDDLELYNFLVEIEALEFGEIHFNHSFVHYADVLLQFKTDNISAFQSFEKDGVVYKKQKG